jgi:hypothetical protein
VQVCWENLQGLQVQCSMMLAWMAWRQRQQQQGWQRLLRSSRKSSSSSGSSSRRPSLKQRSALRLPLKLCTCARTAAAVCHQPWQEGQQASLHAAQAAQQVALLQWLVRLASAAQQQQERWRLQQQQQQGQQ